MDAVMAYLHDFNFVTVLIRLLLAMLCGGVVGFGRSKQARPAGFRTYMLISIGACMAVLISLYEYEMLKGAWSATVEEVGMKYDASRLVAQAITGIGFLGAGIIIKIAHQQVQGLTTATGLFATVCMGIASGAGFYEAVLPAVLMIELVLNVMSPLEGEFKRRLRNITLNVEFSSVEDIGTITQVLEKQNVHIFDIDIERTEQKGDKAPSAIFILKMPRENHSHSGILSTLAELPCVYSVQELIA